MLGPSKLEFLQNLRVLLADPLNDDDPCEKFYGVQMDRVNEFASPYYPQKYPPNMECIRVISAPRGHDIVVFFEDTFQIESSFEGITTKGATASTAPCLNDYIEARDGWYGFSPLIGRFCGNLLPSNELRAHSGAMWLHFHSDDALQYRGFRARYQFARSRTPSTTKRSASECYFAHSFSLDGYIDAAQFRSYYESNRIASGDMAECVWRIEMPKKMTVSLFVEELSLGVLNDCTANSVEIYAGNTANSPLQRLCGTSSGNTMTNNHIVYIRMQAYGGAVAAMHVRILYSAFLTEDACYANEGFRCGDGTCVPGVLVCNSRYNCLYRSDERSCHYVPDSFQSFLSMGYGKLVVIVLAVLCGVILVSGISVLQRHRIRKRRMNVTTMRKNPFVQVTPSSPSTEVTESFEMRTTKKTINGNIPSEYWAKESMSSTTFLSSFSEFDSALENEKDHRFRLDGPTTFPRESVKREIWDRPNFSTVRQKQNRGILRSKSDSIWLKRISFSDPYLEDDDYDRCSYDRIAETSLSVEDKL